MSFAIVQRPMQLPPDVINWLAPFASQADWEFLGGNGGYSGALLWRQRQARQALCVRRWPREHPSPERLAQIHRWLRHCRELPYVPVPLTGTDGATWLENATGRWECTPWLSGVADFHQHFDADRLREAAKALAQLHQRLQAFAETSNSPCPAVAERIKRLRQLTDGGLERLQSIRQRSADEILSPLADHVFRAVQRLGPRLEQELSDHARWPQPLQPCVRDIWHDHLLFDEGKLTGIVDYGAMNVDSVATDLGRLFGSLVEDRHDLWRIAQDAYDEVHPLNESTWRLARVLDRSGCLLGAINWLTWIWIENRTFEEPQRAYQRLSLLVRRLDRWLGSSGDDNSLTLESSPY